MQTVSKTSLTICATVGILLLQACATPSGGTQGGTDPNSGLKNVGLGAVIGAVAGAAISKGTGGEKTGRDAAIGAALGAAGGYVWNQRMEQQRIAMEEATKGTGIKVEKTANNELKLDIPADAGFAVNQAAVQPRLQSVLNTFAGTLQSNNTTLVRIVGHTDSTGSDSINEPLSMRRAEATRDFLVSKGVNSRRLNSQGMGSRAPIADNSTASGKAQNRRVEIYVTQAAN
ncbi:MAG: hypothetical protein RJB34_1716 [Pseudomonadota bacterium]|jgi:outer membrane protein OmpA-like peptidoglycan-associated protein